MKLKERHEIAQEPFTFHALAKISNSPATPIFEML